jgi:superfamily I DNA/RNA helicase
MGDFTWTPEQEQVFTYGVDKPDENLIINALAGSAKSTTLVELVRRVFLAGLYSSALVLAFNKRIADEMNAKELPQGAAAQTLNSLGYRALRSLVPKLGRPDVRKRGDLLRQRIDRHRNTDEIKWLNDNYMDLLEAVRLAPNVGWVPEKKYPAARSLVENDDEFFDRASDKINLELPPFAQSVIYDVHCASIDAVFKEGRADFDDQIFIPTLWPASFPRYELILGDEAQDFSPLQHEMLRKVVGRGRFIAVGDAYQAIYAFRGADESSMRHLQTMFNMMPLTLSTSFRCPRSIAEHVRWRAPFIQSPDWAVEGEVNYLEQWGHSVVEDGSVVICRNNAPLFNVALLFLREGRRPQIVGNDIIKMLIRDLSDLSRDKSIPQNEVIRLLEVWKERQKAKYKNHKRLEDRFDCLNLFVEEAEDLKGAIEAAKRVEAMRGSVTFITGHKAKGQEWENVFFLNQHLCKEGQGQEDNLRYVICTRAKRSLTYIDSDDFVPGEG